MTKTIKLRHTRTFIAMFISRLFYIFPEFLSEIRVNCFYNQNKVNILLGNILPSSEFTAGLNHSLKLSIPVTIYLPPQFVQHFFYRFFNSFICIFSQCQCQRKLIYNVSRGQFSWIVSPHLYGHLHLRVLQAIGHNIFPLRDSFCRITSDIRCVQHGILCQRRISTFQQLCSHQFFRNINRSFYWIQQLISCFLEQCFRRILRLQNPLHTDSF